MLSTPMQNLASSVFSFWHFGHFIFDALQILREVDLRDKRMGLLVLGMEYKRDAAFCQFKGYFYILYVFPAPLNSMILSISLGGGAIIQL